MTRSDNSLASFVVFFGFLLGSCRQKQFWNQCLVSKQRLKLACNDKADKVKIFFRTWRQTSRDLFRLQGLRAVPKRLLWNATSPRDITSTRKVSECLRVFALLFDWVKRLSEAFKVLSRKLMKGDSCFVTDRKLVTAVTMKPKALHPTK